MSMPVITLSAASKTSSAPRPPLILKNTREASFSSYLDASEETFVRNHRIHDDKEIDVFDAQKYFNDALNCSPKVSLPPLHHKKDDLTIKKQQQPAVSISSESSWNSRSALLGRNQQLKKANKKSFLATIGCNCTCADRNSVDIDDDYRVGRFSFPVFSEKKKEDAEKPRVISSPANNNLTMVTWNAIEDLKIPSISSEMQDDSDSDASSDLFEIDSLYKDNPNCMTPTTCYAPSEASVEWSVVTASAADFSLLSDSEEVASPKKLGIASKTLQLKDIPRIRPSILSGCKSYKAVSVAGDAHARRHVTPLTRFHDERKLIFDAKTRHNTFDARITSQPRSASAAHLLYTL